MKLNLEKKKKGAITMCTILDAAEERGVNRGETLKLIMMVQKKIKKGDSIAKIHRHREEPHAPPSGPPGCFLRLGIFYRGGNIRFGDCHLLSLPF